MSQLQQAERAHARALQALASIIAAACDGEPIPRADVADLLVEIDGQQAIDEETIEQIAGGTDASR